MSYWIIGISTVVSLAGTAVSVQGQQNAAKAAENSARYNSELQRQQADQENKVVAENARRKARENNRELARIRAANAASGLTMEGTPLAVLGETAAMLDRDIQDMSFEASNRYRALIQGAQMDIWQGENEAAALRTQSYATALQGVSSATSGYLTSSGKLKRSPKSTTAIN